MQVSFGISQKTLERLDWAQVLERLAEHARTPQARREYSEKLEKLQERRERVYHEMRDDLDRSFRDAHAEIAGVVRELQRADTSQQAAKARAELLEIAARSREAEERSALRRVVREHLDTTPYVTRVMNAEPNEGGDGVTIALLSG